MEARSAEPRATVPVFDRGTLLERVDGDEALMSAVLEVFLDDVPHALRAIDGALDRMDLTALRSAAHALKGAAANISAEALSMAAQELERLAETGRQGEAAAAVQQVRSALATLRPVLEHAVHNGGLRSCRQ